MLPGFKQFQCSKRTLRSETILWLVLARLDNNKQTSDNHLQRAQTPVKLEKQPQKSTPVKGNVFPLELNNSLKQVVKGRMQNSDTWLLKWLLKWLLAKMDHFTNRSFVIFHRSPSKLSLFHRMGKEL